MTNNHYYGIIKPQRKDFITNPNKEEEEIMVKHFNYLKDLLDSKKLVLAGPTLIKNDPFGVMIFETETLEEARNLMLNDPSVKANIQIIFDLRPIRLSLFRNIERK
jgi:uncharacterized protein YciI